MKRENKKIIASILLSLVVFSTFTYAQEDGEDSGASLAPPGRFEPTPEQQLEFRNKILDAFGIPRDTALSVFDIMRGRTNGTLKQPYEPLEDLKIVLDKDDLNPGEQVQAVAVSFSADLELSTISWYINGSSKPALSGKGATLYDFTLGGIGSRTTIRVVVRSNIGITKEIVKTVYPSRVHLVWSAENHIPLWYKGKALPSNGSQVTVHAFPDFRIGTTRLSNADLFYDWKIENKSVKGASGIGRSSMTFTSSKIGDPSRFITVEVSDTQKRIVHLETLTVETVEPILLFYENDPLYGTKKSRAYQNGVLSRGNTVTLELEPFFIPIKELATAVFKWKINSEPVEADDSSARTFSLTADEESIGSHSISVEMESAENFFRDARAGTFVNIAN